MPHRQGNPAVVRGAHDGDAGGVDPPPDDDHRAVASEVREF